LQFIWIAGCPEQSCSICSSSTLSWSSYSPSNHQPLLFSCFAVETR
jgi:hypothetical protein